MKRRVTVIPEEGLHARPAAKFVEAAKEFDCDLTVEAADEDVDPVNARSMLAVTSLGVAEGDDVIIHAEGDDAEAALNRLEEILSTPEEGDEENDDGDD